MGTVHKFKRPPKNEQQFKGYSPNGLGGGKPPRKPRFWQRLKPWQHSAIAWAVLVLLAAAISVGRTLLA